MIPANFLPGSITRADSGLLGGGPPGRIKIEPGLGGETGSVRAAYGHGNDILVLAVFLAFINEPETIRGVFDVFDGQDTEC